MYLVATFLNLRRMIVLALFTVIAALTSSATYTWPNYVMDELEHLLVDTGGFNDGGVKSAITPCSNYVSGSQLAGRETAAQWIRVAFHDFATANLSAGTGGLDASIGFETLRAENSGASMNDTLGFFVPYVNAHVSMADLLALSVVMAVRSCSSPSISIPLRGGRIDAIEAGPFGVPEPETSLQATLQGFKTAGFDQSDTIALTACGHTMGSVHYDVFPDVVPASSVTPNNTNGGVPIDTSPAAFDFNVMNEYLTGTGQKGGPLVTTENVTVRSDLRLYSSDNNATVKHLATSLSHFTSTCVNVFTRMIDTTPATVTLSDVVVPNVMKPVDIMVTVDSQASLAFSGYIRLLSSGWSKDSTVVVSWASRTGSNSGSASTQAKLTESGTSFFGTTYYHSFSTSIDPQLGISSFKITVKDGSKTIEYTNGEGGYHVQDTVMWMPAESSMSPTGASIRAAVLTSIDPKSVSAVFSIPTPQSGTMSPKITTSTIVLTKESIRGLYTVYAGSVAVPLTNINQTTVDIVAVTSTDAVVKNEFNKLQSVVS